MCLQQQPKKSIFQFSYVPQLIFSFALLTALHINQYSVGQFLISMLFRYFLPNVYLIDWSKTLSTPNTCLDSFYIVSSPVIHIQCNRFVSTISAPFTWTAKKRSIFVACFVHPYSNFHCYLLLLFNHITQIDYNLECAQLAPYSCEHTKSSLISYWNNMWFRQTPLLFPALAFSVVVCTIHSKTTSFINYKTCCLCCFVHNTSRTVFIVPVCVRVCCRHELLLCVNICERSTSNRIFHHAPTHTHTHEHICDYKNLRACAF